MKYVGPIITTVACRMIGAHILDFIMIIDDITDPVIETEHNDDSQRHGPCSNLNIGQLRGIYVYDRTFDVWCNDKGNVVSENKLPCVEKWNFSINPKTNSMQCVEQRNIPLWYNVDTGMVDTKWNGGTYYGVNSDFSILDSILLDSNIE